MARELVPIKLLISFDDKGNFDDGLFLYKMKIDGITDDKQKSIAIKNMAFSKLHMTGILDIVIKKTEKEEGVE